MGHHVTNRAVERVGIFFQGTAQVAVGEDAKQLVVIRNEGDAKAFVGNLEQRGLHTGITGNDGDVGTAAHHVTVFCHQAAAKAAIGV